MDQPLPLSFAPVPRLKDRSNGWKPHIQRAFIEALADTGSVRAACRRVGRTEHGAYQLRRHPQAQEFRAAWEAALALGIRRIEDVAMDRALNGVEVPVYSYGQLIGTRTTYNDRLLMFLLRNRAPDRFADGRAKAMNAVDRTQLERMKQKWRQEWEAEQDTVSPAEIRASIAHKVEMLRREVQARTSPRARAAWEEYMRIRAEDEAAGYRADRDPDHPDYREPGQRAGAAGHIATGEQPSAASGRQGRPAAAPYGAQASDAGSEAEPPQAGQPSRPAIEGENRKMPVVRSLKDERWE